MSTLITKNRDREQFTFANINLLGHCNADCYFCLGKDIKDELAGKNQMGVHWEEWKNFWTFLKLCKKENVKKLYLTGQTADGLQYKHLDTLVDFLQAIDFVVGVRTNGYLAEKKIESIKKMKGEIGYSIHSLDPQTNWRIMGRADIPNWDNIIPNSGDDVRVAIVINRFNLPQIDDVIKYISKFKNVKYIQLRRISTDTRYNLLEKDIGMFESFYRKFSTVNKQTGEIYGAQIFNLYGKDITFWRTVECSVNSLNYFTDGTVSDEYFVIEGYLKNMSKEEK